MITRWFMRNWAVLLLAICAVVFLLAVTGCRSRVC
jgi:O-antigen ligase